MFMADRIALMRRGRIVQTGRPSDLYCRPEDPFTAAFFSEINVFTGTVEGGAVDTPLGRADARGLPEGSRVKVLIRPEALRLVNSSGSADSSEIQAAGGVPAVVTRAHILGSSSLVRLRLEPGGAEVVARIPGCEVPAEGASVGIRLDPAHSFVFPAENVQE